MDDVEQYYLKFSKEIFMTVLETVVFKNRYLHPNLNKIPEIYHQKTEWLSNTSRLSTFMSVTFLFRI